MDRNHAIGNSIVPIIAETIGAGDHENCINFRPMIEEAKSKVAQSLLRRLRNANRGDALLVQICNDTIAMIKNLTKASQFKMRGDDEAASTYA